MIAFCGQPLDRADGVRGDPARLAQLQADGLLLRLDGLVPELTERGGLQWDALGSSSEDLVFLGLRDGRGHFAAVPREGNADPAYLQRPIWNLLGVLSGDDLAIYGTARSLLDWHARHGFCARCGQPTAMSKAGWQRDCPACGTQHFPRVDPVAIMIVEHDGKLLLGRNARFPPGSYSALAGFVEPGESIEDAIVREVLEEAGVAIHSVRYIASQPWPFPSQLMLGCHAVADDPAITLDPAELEDARWFTRAEVAEALERGAESTSFKAPPPQAIAHSLLRWWLETTP